MSGKRAEIADEEEIALATSAVAWACDLAGTSDYEHNLHAIALSGSVEPSTSGLAASMWIAYEREMQREVERKVRLVSVAGSTWQGTVDAPTGVLFLTVTKVLDLDGEFGVSHLHLMQDDRGNAFKWFASSERLDVGTLYRIEGKVKKHEDFKGIQSTVLIRCSASDPTQANVILSPAMRKLYTPSGLVPIVGDVFQGTAETLRQARDGFAQIKGKSAERAVARIEAALATITTTKEEVAA
jgi:hypothetical protein